MSSHPSSMTGFARSSGRFGGLVWSWEARSVNSKGLDVRLRLPPGYEHVDPPTRKAVKERFARGSVALQLILEREETASKLHLNANLVAQLRGFARQVDGEEGPTLAFADMLSVRGILEPAGSSLEAESSTDAPILADLNAALDGLATARLEEGARLAAVLGGQLDGLSSLIAQARVQAGTQPDKLRERLKNQLSVILEEASTLSEARTLSEASTLSEDRLLQEVALLATRADITEELDRLHAHQQQARDLLASGGPVGRRLDFLCQELNREANTICSKSTDLALTRSGMELKALIEQFREQVQNIE